VVIMPGMNEGSIVWDAVSERPDIMYRDGTFHGGLHCGETFEVMAGGKWRQARIEYRQSTDSWYLLVTSVCEEFLWLTVRN